MSKDQTIWRQDFFKEVEPIKLKDPLSYLLGSQKEGEPFVFTYGDVVRLAGHSCPAVSGAYRLTQIALKGLYPEDLPVRGEILVLIKGKPTDLAYGPQSQVISFITGASGETGFKGLGGRFSRYRKLLFDTEDFQFNAFIFQREDTKKTLKITYNPQVLPQDKTLSDLTPTVVRGMATPEEKELFISLWQENVRRILLETDRYPGLFSVEELKDFKFPDKKEV